MTNPATPGGGGMPKWAIILIVIGLVLLLGCGCGFTACYFMCQRVGAGLKAGVEAATREAEAQAKARGMEVAAPGAEIALPDSFPADVTKYSGFRAMAKVAPPGENSGMVTFTGKEDPAKVAAFYESDLKGKGWAQVSAAAQAGTFTQTYTKGEQSLILNISADGGETTLVITYGKK